MPGGGRSIDVTDPVPTATGQAADEVIDLAGDSPTTSGNTLILFVLSDSQASVHCWRSCR